MAGQLKEIRSRIQSIQSTQQITKAMKMASVNKLKKSQDAIAAFMPYAHGLDGVLRRVLRGDVGVGHPCCRVHDKGSAAPKLLLIVIGSDKGLCGGHNTQLIKFAQQHVQEKFAGAQLTMLPIGRKIMEYCVRNEVPHIADYTSVLHDPELTQVRPLSHFLEHKYVEETYDRVEIVYAHFINMLVQKPTVRTLLPYTLSEENKIDHFKHNKNEKQAIENTAHTNDNLIYEPDATSILESLVPQLIYATLLECMLDTRAAEHAARVSAMDQATENANGILHDLKISYNRARQAIITGEIIEIISGSAAAKS